MFGLHSVFLQENEFVQIERVRIGEIPCLRMRPKGVEINLPTVVYYHGWSSNKEYQRFKGMTLASFGYQVLVPDAIHHGERDPIPYRDAQAMEQYFWRVVLQNVEESKGLIEEIINTHNGDPNRIGVMGNSMGGFSAAGVFIQNENIRCMVNFNGSCAWMKAEEIFRKTKGISESSAERGMDLSAYDPMANKTRLRGRPILMLHGDSDTSVPIDSQRLFYFEVEGLYKETPEKLKFLEIPRMDHYISTGMLEEAILWFKKYL